jgi:hypothetical protein
MALTKLVETQDVGRVALVKSLLEANGIPYVVQNEHFGSLYPGVPFSPGHGMIVMVSEWDAERAETLLGELNSFW